MRRLQKRRNAVPRGTNRRAPAPLAPPTELRLITTTNQRVVTTQGNKVLPYA